MKRDKKLIIEARINEYAMRDNNKNVPWSPEEIAETATACREAGAAIVHFHPRDAGGQPSFDYELYADTIRRIRSFSDILIHPTLGWIAATGGNATAEERLSNIVRLAQDGYPVDFVPLDMGSTNADSYHPAACWYRSEDKVYVNTIDTLKYFANSLNQLRIAPNPIVWNLSMMRTLGVFLNRNLLPKPSYVMLGLSDNDALVTHPGTVHGLLAYLDNMPFRDSVEWTAGRYGGNVLPLVGSIIEFGGHVAIGLGDYSYSHLDNLTNEQLVARVAQIANECECEVASPAETRSILKLAR